MFDYLDTSCFGVGAEGAFERQQSVFGLVEAETWRCYRPCQCWRLSSPCFGFLEVRAGDLLGRHGWGRNKTKQKALWVARLVLFTWCLIWFTWFRCGCHGARAFQVSQLFCCFFTVSMFYTWSTVLLHCLYMKVSANVNFANVEQQHVRVYKTLINRGHIRFIHVLSTFTLQTWKTNISAWIKCG